MAEHKTASAQETEAIPHMAKDKPTEAQTPQTQAKQTALDVGQRLSNESLDAAYQELKGDMNTAKTSMSDADFKKYRKELTTSLEQSGLLPQLSLAWADNAFSKLDADNSQSIEKPEAEAYAKRANQLDDLSASMARNFAKLMFANRTSDMPVTRGELRSLIDENNPLARSEEQSREVVSFLGQDRPYLNGMNLFEVLDMAGDQGNPKQLDGKISKRDIESLLNDPLVDYLSKDDSAFLTAMVEHWEHPDVKRLRDEKGLITPDSIMVATGELRARRAQEELRRQQQEQDAKDERLFGIRFPNAIKL